MNKNTALGASEVTKNIIFQGEMHKKFFLLYLPECRNEDVYHQALIYCLGISRDTREHVEEIYDFETGCVKTECMSAGWQTSGSLKIIRMAFNLYCNGTPTVYEKEGVEGKLKECEHYTVEDRHISGRRFNFVIQSIAECEVKHVKNQITGNYQ